MRVRLYQNAEGDACTEDFNPRVDDYDPVEEAKAQAALDDYAHGYDDGDDWGAMALASYLNSIMSDYPHEGEGI